MSRRLRYIPPEGAVVEIVHRIIDGRFFLRPSPLFNRIVVGCLAQGLSLHPVGVIGVAVLSNHLHLLLRVDDVEQMADFMGQFAGNLAREANRRLGRKGKVWDGRYRATLVSEEEAAQRARLLYLLSQGVKEGLVARPRDWPGVHCASAILAGEPLRGYWFDRTAEGDARRRGERPTRYEHAKRCQVELEPLPCWAHLPPEEYRVRVGELVDEIVDRSTQERLRSGRRVLGRKAILAQDPWSRPKGLEWRPQPLIHAVSGQARQRMTTAYRWFVQAYREASARLRAGDLGAIFPPGCFPPAPVFVPAKGSQEGRLVEASARSP